MKRIIFIFISIIAASAMFVYDYVTPSCAYFIRHIENAGIKYSRDGIVSAEDSELFAAAMRILAGYEHELIFVYEYQSVKAADADADRIVNGNLEICTEYVDTDIYIFKKDRLIIKFEGENKDTLEFLTNNFGEKILFFSKDNMT
jgi:hypothetical protein